MSLLIASVCYISYCFPLQIEFKSGYSQETNLHTCEIALKQLSTTFGSNRFIGTCIKL